MSAQQAAAAAAASCRAVEPGLITQMFCREKARSAEAPLVSQERGRGAGEGGERASVMEKMRRTAVCNDV